ncbi:hypothetical protein BP5796_01348 [Coleophoma crateriformis]|uniref:Spo7-domain-containing protein n=1 Tax=Coleophoma crateriformis TaxID=565419 RepID=A0A3D8T084_9HELO|nr:hypothetical protein BP5796_01348 [Coleophoma crateriformis]
MSSKLDQLVKGAPPPGNVYNLTPTTPILASESPSAPALPDPLASLPSSPPQIYLNLLILEASLRAQWLQLRTRRRQHTFFLTLLGLWILCFGYALFLAPREDGSGVGGSVYWVVEVFEKMCLMGGVVTGILVWGTGQWERGVRWPRRFIGHTNRGLRGFNCKLVVIKQPWWKEFASMLSFLFSYGLFSSSSGDSYQFVDQGLLIESEKATKNGGHHALPNIHENDETPGYEEDLAPGGDYVKLLLLPKPFSPGFRENWDIYRTEYWEKENERRQVLRVKLKERERKIAKEEGGWIWWTGWRGWKRRKGHGGRGGDIEKTNLHARHSLLEKDPKRIRSGSIRSGSHSRSSSRSSTPALDNDEFGVGHTRRGSTASSASERRRKKGPTGARIQKLTPSGSMPGSRSSTPEVHSPLLRENSFTSVSSLDEADRPSTPLTDGESTRSLRSSANVARKSSLGRQETASSP